MAAKILLNEIKVSIILSRLCQQLIERHKDFSNVVLVGLQPRGTSLLEELLKLLKEQGLKSIKSGTNCLNPFFRYSVACFSVNCGVFFHVPNSFMIILVFPSFVSVSTIKLK